MAMNIYESPSGHRAWWRDGEQPKGWKKVGAKKRKTANKAKKAEDK